jgi:hypothetical protein
MGVFVLLLAEIVVQLLAVGLALRLARIGGRLVPWGAVGAAIGLIALWQVVDIVRIAAGAATAPAIGPQVQDLILSLLLLLGIALWLRRFQAPQRVRVSAWRRDRRPGGRSVTTRMRWRERACSIWCTPVTWHAYGTSSRAG